MRVFLAAATQVAGLQQLLARFVDRRGPVINGPYQGIPMGLSSHEWKMFANLHPWDIGPDGAKGAANILRGCRFQVPGIQMAGAANQKQKDTVNVFERTVGTGFHEFCERQAYSTRSQAADPEKVSPGQAITRLNAVFARQL